MRADATSSEGHPAWFAHTLVSGAQADVTIKAGPGVYGGFIVTAGDTDGAIEVYDGPVASGELILKVTGLTAPSNTARAGPMRCANSIHVKTTSVGGLLRVQVLWR